MIGTGARPVRPDLPGIDEPWVHGVQTLEDGSALLEAVERGRCRDVVVVGAGYIGLEMAEAFHRRGAQVTLVDADDHVMGRTLDPDISECLGDALAKLGVEVRLGERVEAFEGGRVITGTGALPADLVVLGLGVEPNSQLAEEAGLELGEHGAIHVDRRQRTSADGVYAAGDCADTFDTVAGRRTYIALGTVANRTARVAGINLGGGYATFPGVVGTAVTKVCDFEVGRTGLTEHEASAAGFGAVTVTIDSTVRAGYFPGAEPVTVKTRRRGPHGAPARRADRRWSRGGQADRRAGHRPLRPPHGGRPGGRRPVLRAALLAGLGSGAGRGPESPRPGLKALSQI